MKESWRLSNQETIRAVVPLQNRGTERFEHLQYYSTVEGADLAPWPLLFSAFLVPKFIVDNTHGKAGVALYSPIRGRNNLIDSISLAVPIETKRIDSSS